MQEPRRAGRLPGGSLDLQGRAGKADESMRIAQVLIGLGFIVFLGYPAVVAIASF